MSISDKIEKSLEELYDIVRGFVNKEELGFDADAKERNLKAMGMVVDGVQLMADGLEEMDPIILRGLTESFVSALMNNMSYRPEDIRTFVERLANDRDDSLSWTLEKIPEAKSEPKPEERPEVETALKSEKKGED